MRSPVLLTTDNAPVSTEVRKDLMVVLQKLLEVRKADWERVFLCNHSSGLIEEDNPLLDGSLENSHNLSFAHHVHNLVVLNK